jgi:hypothetical protein
MAGIGLVLGLAVVLLILSVATGAVGGNQTKATELVQAAEAKRVQAQQSAETDPVGARTLLTQANSDLEAARKEKAG